MSIRTDRFLKCDECGRQTRCGFQAGSNQSALFLRVVAKDSGWAPIGRKDYCPECTEKRRRRDEGA